ncbi:hypothetical protein BH23BAC1_BH23BAC1_12700 [soil metagenome]
MGQDIVQKADISFNVISKNLYVFAFPEVDLIIGIGRGGIVPASLVAHQLHLNLKIIRVIHRDEQNQPKYDTPVFLDNFSADIDPQARILLVDDVSVTGKTLELVKYKLRSNKVYTFVLKGKADLVLFPEISTCVNWPWKHDYDN